jgi:ribosomal-protein-alanine N-acetyltransferase
MTSPTTLRPARADDLPALLALEQATPEAPHWAESLYARIVNEETPPARRCLLIAESQGAIVGFSVGLLPLDAAEPGELETVVVAAPARRAGIGRALGDAVVEWLRLRNASAVVLEVRARSTGAIALYAAMGFAVEGRRGHYYANPQEDALLMRLDLRPPNNR